MQENLFCSDVILLVIARRFAYSRSQYELVYGRISSQVKGSGATGKEGERKRMAGLLENKVALVTGSGRGIGKEIALLMAAEGARLIVNDLGVATDGSGGSGSAADAVVEEIKSHGGTAVANYDSVADARGADRMVGMAIESFGRLDVLVNNAGILRDRMIWNMSDDDFD